MIELVYGGSGSGKSEFAENEILRLSSKVKSKRFYIATMKIVDEESKQKVARHKNLRAKKDFITIEACENIEKAAEIILSSSKKNQKKSFCCKNQQNSQDQKFENPPKICVLLECLSNLAANEMFLENGEILKSEKVEKKIESALEKLFSVADDIVIVSNNIFEDGIEYGETTREYQKTLAKLNAFAARRADKVSEIVAGIEVRVR